MPSRDVERLVSADAALGRARYPPEEEGAASDFAMSVNLGGGIRCSKAMS